MNPKKIILCPNPNRDHGMKTTKAAEKILHDLGFQTVVCSPFKDHGLPEQISKIIYEYAPW